MVSFSADVLLSWLGSVMWPFLRISGLCMTAPIVGSPSVPVRIRVFLAFLLACMVAGSVQAPSGITILSLSGMLIGALQVVIGLTMGFLMLLAFTAVVMAGQAIAMTSGLGFATVVDPDSGVQVPVVSQFMLMLATLLFLATDGHLVMLAMLIRSFEAVPLDLTRLPAETFLVLVEFTGHVFAVALLMALPALLAVLMVNLALGVITRAAPQLNIFAVGFPITILVGFLALLLSLDGFQVQTVALFEAAFERLQTVAR